MSGTISENELETLSDSENEDVSEVSDASENVETYDFRSSTSKSENECAEVLPGPYSAEDYLLSRNGKIKLFKTDKLGRGRKSVPVYSVCRRQSKGHESNLLFEIEGMAAEQSSDVNISDVFEVIETVEMNAGRPGNGADSGRKRPLPEAKITVQPASKALRFRYECEGRSAGSIPGVNSTHENKTYPTIEIPNYKGKAMVVVSLVTKDAPYRPHPHNLVGKEGCDRGVCTVKMTTNTVSFPNLGIQCVKKKDIDAALKLREEINVDPFRTGFSHKNQPSNIDLNCVRLCFQVFLEGPEKGIFLVPLKAIVSDPIYDKKAMSDLTICKLSHCSDSVAGGQEVILLCEKIAKEDIMVRFYEERNNELYWEAQGDFQPVQVHKQVAIPFKVPQYKTIHIDRPVSVMLQLRRPSDGAVSESVPFTYTPLDSGRATFWSLHRALTKKGEFNSISNILNASPVSQETQKRKLDAITPLVMDEFKEVKKPLIERNSIVENKKDSLISGGTLVTLPQQPLTIYEKEPKVIGLDSVKAAEVPSDNADLFSDPHKISKNESLSKRDFAMEDNNNVENETDKMIDDSKKDLENETFKTIQTSDMDNSQSFNDLITQVAELDEIYSENKERLALTRDELEGRLDDTAMDCREIFDDSHTYTSLQLAMKNPVNPLELKSYEDVVPVKGPIINIGKSIEEPEEKLPPLPPKRVKKTPPKRPDTFPHSKTLPKIPDNKARAKQSIFLKLFSKKKTDVKDKDKEEATKYSSSSNLTNLLMKEDKRKTSLDDLTNPRSNEKSIPRWLHRGSTGNMADNSDVLFTKEDLKTPEAPEVEKGGAYLENYTCKDDFDLALDLTEAENYALYTAMAPHATASEFDEMSFYYSPVEGGKILNEDNLKSRIKDIDLASLDPVVLQRKRKKYGGESGPQNMYRSPQDDDSRSGYDTSPDIAYHLLQVKSEPPEYSPMNYNCGRTVSPGYARSPESISSHKTPSPVPPTNYSNFNLFKFNSGGGILEVNHPCKQDVPYPEAGTSKQTAGAPLMPYPSNYVGSDLGEGGSCVQGTSVQQCMNPAIIGSMSTGTVYHHGLLQKNESVTNRSQIPDETGNTFVNMDSQHMSTELNTNHLDTDELASMAIMMTEANLSANLSNNLTLDDNPLKSSVACDQSTMTDSYAIVPDNEIQELIQFSAMNQTSQQ